MTERQQLEARRSLSASLRRCIEEIEHLSPRLEAELTGDSSAAACDWDAPANALQVLAAPIPEGGDIWDWDEATDENHLPPSSACDEVWRLYMRSLRPLLLSRPRAFWALRWHHDWRPRIARALCSLAAARMAQEPFATDAGEEIFLWLLACETHKATVSACSNQPWLRAALDEHGYTDTRHRLADAILHAAPRAEATGHASLIIETFVAETARPMRARGWSRPANLDAFLQEAAGVAAAPEEAAPRLSLCYRLKILGYQSAWLDAALAQWKRPE